MSLRSLATAFAALALAAPVRAEDLPTPGHVQIPVEVYTQLIEASRDPSRVPRRAPAGYALGNAKVTPVESATVGGAPVQLVAAPSGLGWATNKKGSHAMSLTYRVDAQRSAGGFARGWLRAVDGLRRAA